MYSSAIECKYSCLCHKKKRNANTNIPLYSLGLLFNTEHQNTFYTRSYKHYKHKGSKMAKYHTNKIMLSQRYSLPVCSFENRRRYVHGLLVWGKWDSVLSKVFCLFVCVNLIVPLENLSLIWRRHHCRWWAANCDLRSALMAIEQWGFFNVPHLL